MPNPHCAAAYLQGYLVQQWSEICPITYRLSRAVTPEQLRWQPYGCNLPLHSEFDFESCKQNRYFCFVGDSQQRTAYNTFTNSFVGELTISGVWWSP